MLSFWSFCALSYYKGALPTLTSAPAVEPQMLSAMKDKNNQSLVENLMGTTKSQQFSCLLIRVAEGIRTHGQRISMREL